MGQVIDLETREPRETDDRDAYRRFPEDGTRRGLGMIILLVGIFLSLGFVAWLTGLSGFIAQTFAIVCVGVISLVLSIDRGMVVIMILGTIVVIQQMRLNRRRPEQKDQPGIRLVRDSHRPPNPPSAA